MLLICVTVTPVFAERVVEVTKEIDVRKEILATVLMDLRSYKEIFPMFVKDVQINSKTNQAKFIIIAQGAHEADVKSSVLQDGSFVIDIISGDLKGSQIITSLEKRVGFDGTPNGATTVKATLTLETSWWITAALTFVNDSDIEKAVGDGFYDLGKYAKSTNPQGELIKIDHEEKTSTQKFEASKKEPQVGVQKPTVFAKTEKFSGRNSVFVST